MSIYTSIINNIEKTDREFFEKANARMGILAKPPGSLGRLEETAARICAIKGTLSPEINKRCVIVVASDNGVVEEGVASAPQSVTAVQTINILNGLTGVGVIAKEFNADLLVADVGVNADISHPQLIDRKIRKSTGNIAKVQAMSRNEAIKAVEIGIELVETAKKSGYEAIGAGEMGIGNTTTGSAVLAALLGLRGSGVSSVTGRGAGLDDEAYAHKISVIRSVLELHNPSQTEPLDILHNVGGFDICAMAGVFVGAAYYKLPAVVDGFISSVAALCAVRMNPIVKEYLFMSHLSYERGYALAAREIGLEPFLNLDMRLGEGSGCPFAFGVMDASLALLKNMATFGEADIDSDYTKNIDSISF